MQEGSLDPNQTSCADERNLQGWFGLEICASKNGKSMQTFYEKMCETTTESNSKEAQPIRLKQL